MLPGHTADRDHRRPRLFGNGVTPLLHVVEKHHRSDDRRIGHGLSGRRQVEHVGVGEDLLLGQVRHEQTVGVPDCSWQMKSLWIAPNSIVVPAGSPLMISWTSEGLR